MQILPQALPNNTDSEIPVQNNRHSWFAFCKAAFAFAKPYWQSEHKVSAWSLLAGVIALNFTFIYLNVLSNRWSGVFYEAVQKLDKTAFVHSLFDIAFILSALIVCFIIKEYMQGYLAFKWRAWLTEKMSESWLQNNTFYHLAKAGSIGENPDQRISQDLSDYSYSMLSTSVMLLGQTVNVICFSVILWGLSGPISFSVSNSMHIKIPGYICWFTLIYAFFSTYVVFKVGKPLVNLDFKREQVEANFRFGLMRVRDRREEVALLDGWQAEDNSSSHSFNRIWLNYHKILWCSFKVNFCNTTFQNLSLVLPSLVAAPMLFSGAITFGVFMRVLGAFHVVQRGLLILTQSYPQLAMLKASFERISNMDEAMKSIHKSQASELTINYYTEPGLDFQSVTTVPGTLVNFKIESGEKVLLMGQSGVGKTSLVRALAGLNPQAAGCIIRPHDVLIIPQKPYFPIASLADAVCYPQERSSFTDADIKRVLSLCELGQFNDRLEEVNDWIACLSGGEQQRLNFARVMLHQPACLVMDEPTSSMDVTMEQVLFERLLFELPQLTMLTISHSQALQNFHDRCEHLMV